MQKSRICDAFFRGITAALGGALLLSVNACGSAGVVDAPSDEAAGSISEELINWRTLTLTNGWSAANGSTPAVANINGILTFRGAIKGTPTATDSPFTLPSDLRPNAGGNPPGYDSVQVRVAMYNNDQGTLSFTFNNNPDGASYVTRLTQDRLDGPGADARAYTSLDGVSIDVTSVGATELPFDRNHWATAYAHRSQGAEPALSAKVVNSFVRFQGYLVGNEGNASNYLTNLPQNMRPTQTVYVPVSLCDGLGASNGVLRILSNGDVYVDANQPAGIVCGTSVEGANFAIAAGNSVPLSLVNGWVPFSSRTVKVRNDGGVIRFHGAIYGGSNVKFATLPQNMRPARSISIVADASGQQAVRIRIDAAGNMTVDDASLAYAQSRLSLDGVSFAL